MTYEYVCTACGHEWEASQRINDKPLEKCPRCAKKTAKRLISGGTGFVLKGGGWYADGYASSGVGAKKAEGEAPAAAKPSEPAKSTAASEKAADTPKKAAPAAKSE